MRELHAVACPTCGELLWAPVDLDADGYPVIDEEAFLPVLSQHVMETPEQHPQFVIPQETDRNVTEQLPLLCLHSEPIMRGRDEVAVDVCLAADDHPGGHDLHRFPPGWAVR